MAPGSKNTAQIMLKGSCLCGSIQYELEGPPLFLSYCHCSLCQKASGSVLLAALQSGSSGFQWTRGDEHLGSYESSPGNDRFFCVRCGSNMPAVRGAHITIPAGTLDTELGVKPVVHVYCASKPSWDELSDSLPKFKGLPPESFWSKPGSG